MVIEVLIVGFLTIEECSSDSIDVQVILEQKLNLPVLVFA
jgi:hypothetical protein